MKISDLLDVIEDDTVPIREKDIIASARIMEVTMKKINIGAASAEEKGTMKKVRPVYRTALIAAVAAALLIGTAYAAGSIGRIVNWQGETVGEAEQLLATPLPSIAPDEVERQGRIGSILGDAGSDELVIVKYTDENGVTDIKRNALTETFSSAEELRAALSDNGSELEVFDAPAGYEFFSAQVAYDCAAGYEYALISEETDDSGLLVEKYALPEEGRFISGYMIDYRDPNGNSLFLTGKLLGEEVEFSVGETTTVKRITVTGMDAALVMEQSDGSGVAAPSLEMSKTLTVPVAYVNKAVLTGAHPTDGGDIFSKVWYSFHASGIDADTLLEILTF